MKENQVNYQQQGSGSLALYHPLLPAVVVELAENALLALRLFYLVSLERLTGNL